MGTVFHSWIATSEGLLRGAPRRYRLSLSRGGRMAVVKNEVQQRDQSQTIDCIINIPMPFHLRRVGHRVTEKNLVQPLNKSKKPSCSFFSVTVARVLKANFGYPPCLGEGSCRLAQVWNSIRSPMSEDFMNLCASPWTRVRHRCLARCPPQRLCRLRLPHRLEPRCSPLVRSRPTARDHQEPAPRTPRAPYGVSAGPRSCG